MNHHPMNGCPRLHMGCGEALRSKLLLIVPPRLSEDLVDKPQPKITQRKPIRGRVRR